MCEDKPDLSVLPDVFQRIVHAASVSTASIDNDNYTVVSLTYAQAREVCEYAAKWTREALELEDKVGEFKNASLLVTSAGDAADITPDDISRHIANLRAENERLREALDAICARCAEDDVGDWPIEAILAIQGINEMAGDALEKEKT